MKTNHAANIQFATEELHRAALNLAEAARGLAIAKAEAAMAEQASLLAGELAKIQGPADAHVRRAQQIMAFVCARTGQTIEAMRGPRRTEELCLARSFAISIIREATGLSSKEIGRLYNRGGSDVRHLETAARNRRDTDPRKSAEFAQLRAEWKALDNGNGVAQ